MNKRTVLWAAVAAASLTMAACGGSDDNDSLAPAPGPAPSSSNFIQPLDTQGRSAPATKLAPAPASRLPAGAQAAQVALGPLSVVKQAAAAADKSAPRQIGYARDVPQTASSDALASALTWSVLADGTQVAAIRFDAAGARALRLGVRVDALPAGAVLRFYGTSGPVSEMSADEVAATRQRNEAGGVLGEAARMVWGPASDGDAATLEVQLPAGASAAQARLAVPQLSHLSQTLVDAARELDGISRDTAKGDAGSCNLDVMCSSYQSEGRAVAAMEFVSGGGTYVCSGTLMNDTQNSRTPYFLTAAHCISDQAAASSLTTAWFYRAAACDSSKIDPSVTLLENGAQLLYANRGNDTTLLRLNGRLPANVLFAGSYFGPLETGTDVLAIHHPKGDWQKYSLGQITGWGNCTFRGDDFSCSQASQAAAQHVRVDWSRGVTEGGSSGSAIFVQSNNVRYVVGALSGGGSSCQNPKAPDYYGRFERAFADGIANWLRP